jgi:hypothetical protein
MPENDEFELYGKTMTELDQLWYENAFVFEQQHNKVSGMRSSQIACLVDYLIKKGIIK